MTDSTSADRILDALAAAGVSTAFGLPGVHNLAFWHNLDAADRHPSGVQLMTVRHEQTAAFAADGLARATGGLGVALVTSGPGAANTLAAFGEAAASGVPLLVIASDVPEAMRDRERPRGLLHESADPGAWFAPLAKASLQPTTAEDAVAATAEAIATALAHPRGPVYLGIPADVLAAPAPPVPPVRTPTPAPPATNDVAAAASLISGSRRPALWVGGGAVAAEANVDALAWRLGAPVFATYAGRGLVPSGHPLLVDVPPMEPRARTLLTEADLLLVLGSALDGMTTAHWSLPRPATVVDVNLQPSGALDPELTVVADIAGFVDALTLRIGGREPWADSPFRIRDAVRAEAAADPRTTEAAAVVDALEQSWPEQDAVVCDMAVAGYWAGGYAAVHRPRRMLYPVGWGTLGYALPAAIGVAASGTPTLAVVGDGGLAMGLAELATARQHQLPLVVLVVDDAGYGMLRFDQRRHGRPERGVALRSPEWSELGAAFELPVDSPTTPAELRDALARAAVTGGPRLVVYRAALYPPRSTSPRWTDADG